MIEYIIGTLLIGCCIGIGMTLFYLKKKAKKEINKAMELLGLNKLNKEVKNGRRKFWKRKNSDYGRASEKYRSDSIGLSDELRGQNLGEQDSIQKTVSCEPKETLNEPRENHSGIEPVRRSFEWRSI